MATEKTTVLFNFMIDKEIKAQMEQICKELGLPMTTAFNIFAHKMVSERKIPFEVSARPSAEKE